MPFHEQAPFYGRASWREAKGENEKEQYGVATESHVCTTILDSTSGSSCLLRQSRPNSREQVGALRQPTPRERHWQFSPLAAVNTSQDHVLRSPPLLKSAAHSNLGPIFLCPTVLILPSPILLVLPDVEVPDDGTKFELQNDSASLQSSHVNCN